jgi:hypothetical protein
MIRLAPHSGFTVVAYTALLCGCIGGNGTNPAATITAPTANVATLTVDGGPSAAPGQINHAYVTVKLCAPGSQSSCATLDHVLLDTGSNGLRVVGSVLAALAASLPRETDAQGQTVEECVSFSGGETWGPVVTGDVYLAGEKAAKVPLQIMDDAGTGAPAPAACGANGSLINDVPGFGANGVLGVGVFAQDCGEACVAPGTPLAVYYGCNTAGACIAENAPLALQVTNVVSAFSTDNNGVIVNLPNLVNANGDTSVQGELIFGISTQTDNMLPANLTVLGTDANGDFKASYNGSATLLPALIDSGTDAYAFDDPTLPTCSAGAFVGYYCPTVAPQAAFAQNIGVGADNAVNTVDFAIADPNTFVAGAAAFANLAGGGGSSVFTWGMPFFYGRKIYVGIDQRTSGPYTGPFYAY